MHHYIAQTDFLFEIFLASLTFLPECEVRVFLEVGFTGFVNNMRVQTLNQVTNETYTVNHLPFTWLKIAPPKKQQRV